ncbi:uncharacterized protein G2W53_001326 [Senna tora]|uniref:Uncharacterized protein n=1 Tax=Senna tora TaxID=362788 RepID=A0A835CIH4_9FABA|nr:uncharacterized protein G2W53_001326 [Senna tora]
MAWGDPIGKLECCCACPIVKSLVTSGKFVLFPRAVEMATLVVAYSGRDWWIRLLTTKDAIDISEPLSNRNRRKRTTVGGWKKEDWSHVLQLEPMYSKRDQNPHGLPWVGALGVVENEGVRETRHCVLPCALVDSE